MNYKTRIRFFLEAVAWVPAAIVMVLLGFRSMGRGTRRA